MERRKLGRQGPEISVVGYGAWEAGGAQWGADVDDAKVIEAMEAAIDSGITWIDTAEAYGDGRSEELVGRVAQRDPDRVLVFTKVAPFASGLRPEEVKRAAHASLERLGVDHIDLYQIHWPDDTGDVPIEETWGAMAELQDAGLVRFLGVSNFDRDLVERCLPIRHVDSVQNQFSLLHREDAADLLPWLAEQGVGYLSYGPLAFGLLTGTITKETTFHPDDWRGGKDDLGYYRDLFAPGKLERSVELVDQLRAVADRLDLSISTFALKAAIATPGITGVIAGSRNPDHVRTNAEAGNGALDLATLDEVERILSR
jgi:aryl-alcohol dehydrogenase-like predicted oxidoreductase